MEYSAKERGAAAGRRVRARPASPLWGASPLLQERGTFPAPHPDLSNFTRQGMPQLRKRFCRDGFVIGIGYPLHPFTALGAGVAPHCPGQQSTEQCVTETEILVEQQPPPAAGRRVRARPASPLRGISPHLQERGTFSALISHKEFFVLQKVICRSQFPHKSVNSFFALVIVKDKLSDLRGTSPLLQERGTFTALISHNVSV